MIEINLRQIILSQRRDDHRPFYIIKPCNTVRKAHQPEAPTGNRGSCAGSSHSTHLTIAKDKNARPCSQSTTDRRYRSCHVLATFFRRIQDVQIRQGTLCHFCEVEGINSCATAALVFSTSGLVVLIRCSKDNIECENERIKKGLAIPS